MQYHSADVIVSESVGTSVFILYVSDEEKGISQMR